MTYARSRLWLGMTGVGTMVVLSLLAIFLRFPERLAAIASPSPLGEALTLAAFFGLYVLVSFPFDLLGGYWLPCRFQRQCQIYPFFVFSWLRGVLTQGGILTFSALALLWAGRAAGRAGALLLAASVMAALLALQPFLARLVGGLKPVGVEAEALHMLLTRWGVTPPRMTFVSAADPGFLGGPAGWPGKEELLVPSQWTWLLSPEAAAAALARRVGVLRTGSRRRGVALAFAFNLSALALASVLPRAGVRLPAEIMYLSLYFTLLSFLGLLVLPTFSRRGVLEADRFALEAGVPAEAWERSIREIDQLQDDEPARHPLVETIFHPIPSVDNRLRAALRSPQARPRGAWQAARLALFLSWGCLGLLSHAVHCNSGRPELWVLLPGD